MKRRKLLILGAAALVLVLSTGIGTAWAYFSTYSEAEGGYRLRLARHREVEINEEFSQWTKRISLSNKAGADPIYVRAKVFAPTMISLSYQDESGKWSLGEDGYYYYSDELKGGESTEELQARIGNVPDAPAEGESFNVVVVYESTPVNYRADGTTYADWTVTREMGGADGW